MEAIKELYANAPKVQFMHFFSKQQQAAVKVHIPSEQATCGSQIKVSILVWFSDSTAYQYPMTISFPRSECN